MWPFKPKPVAPLALPPVVTRAIAVNPTEHDALMFARYRIGAILRDREQRKDERREKHGEHDSMTGEAMEYAGKLVKAGLMTAAEMKELMQRLEA